MIEKVKAIRTLSMASTAILMAAVCVYLITRTQQAEPAPIPALATPAHEVELADKNDVTTLQVPARPAVERESVTDASTVGASSLALTNVLRVVLEGVSEEDARMATVTVSAPGEQLESTPLVRDSWPCQGLMSEFDLDGLLTRLAKRMSDRPVDELKVNVSHPSYFSETARVSLSQGVGLRSGQATHEVRLSFEKIVFWSEFPLNVRDAVTREHLGDVELRCIGTDFMGITKRPGTGPPYAVIGDGFASPIGVRGGRKAYGTEERAAGLAIAHTADEALRITEFSHPVENARGAVLFAWAPGYAWGRLVVDFSKSAERELLLVPSAELAVRLTNVQLEAYAVLEKPATLFVSRDNPDGSVDQVWNEQVDETLEADGVSIEGLEPGEFIVTVELGPAFAWRKRKVLAREEFSLSAGEARELMVALPDAPAPAQRAALGGVVSFPTFGGEEDVRMQLYMADYMYGEPDRELSLADMEVVSGALPTWSFHFVDLPVGRYQVRLLPFDKNWVFELPVGGALEEEFVIPELSEVWVETVDARTGERIPLETIRYGSREDLPNRMHHEWSGARITTVFEGEPGRFHFWATPGPAYVGTHGIPSGLDVGWRQQELELVSGHQLVRFELAPACAIHFEFRVNGAALPREDGIFVGLGRTIHAVDHDGRAATVAYEVVPVSGPGVYELNFEGVGQDRFLPIPPRRIDVRTGEATEVIVELRRK